ncbi:dimethylamine monooxygenase subunit DmmA family protein [Pseudodonghicola flavimaris]|uniref:Dimethylamine monooxygenase subunit DmmA family protein n=1 Tax=Pseudodonghicola flavimaris TaxID=3050036 RepID=A0ABT7F2W3_9RHOB|nr:dimethylamine monooxygenase subunit DmmA family protein [Pseudodonghicola flavimaris]MDK3018938.1 dimethylamine monooxygenase subunit DmmA family protein [Pseudodonghicola flavimaris]
MPNTQFSPSIDSRPVYPGLTPHGASPAIMVADAEGAAALRELAARDASVMDRAQVVLAAGGAAGLAEARALQALQPKGVSHEPDLAAALPLLRRLLAEARMGTRLYLAGSEGLIGQVSALALDAGLPADAIESEHRGPIARRMQCVHCKGITEGVTTDPFTCSHCGLTLFVRDHFSRRLGVFQGVCVDAETPGIIPEPQEIRP